MGRYVVTDLTRFRNGDLVCTALIDIDTGECVRPIPYFSFGLVRKYGVIPGALFEGRFSARPNLENPHKEDCSYSDLNLVGAVTAQEFQGVLMRSLSPSVKSGFGPDFDGVKLLPPNTASVRSIITVEVAPGDLRIVKDNFNGYKVHFRDAAGDRYSYIPITDLGFYEYIKGFVDGSDGSLDEVNSHFKNSECIYLRLGMSRIHRAEDARDGYWMQVNGVYSFPSKLAKIRGYAP